MEEKLRLFLQKRLAETESKLDRIWGTRRDALENRLESAIEVYKEILVQLDEGHSQSKIKLHE